ncbi:hypothetical protein [Pelomonas sp. KK5]|uniref:hypothetical protein n=1 Tax=Pelomonas sp. KK5 TaxID=1855730 RepID=UPI001301ACE9|nr:hypothetical protein [Pelomonas sp. KK5]
MWEHVDPGAPGRALRDIFETRPEEVEIFIASYVPESWGVESGLPVPGTLMRENYDAVTRLVDGDYLLGKLLLRYGDELGDPLEYPPGDWAPPRRFAHQFARIHDHVKKQATAEGPAATTDPDAPATAE